MRPSSLITALKSHMIPHAASKLCAASLLHLNNTGNEILVLQIISQVIMIFVYLSLIKISLGKHPLQEEVLTEQPIHNSPQLVNISVLLPSLKIIIARKTC